MRKLFITSFILNEFSCGEVNILELNSTFRIKFSYYRGHIVVVFRAGWDSICTTLSWQSVCFKVSCLPYTAKCNSGIIVRLADNARAYCIALFLFDIFFITDRQRFIQKRIKEDPGHERFRLY